MEAGCVREPVDRVHDDETDAWLDQWVEVRQYAASTVQRVKLGTVQRGS